MAADPDRACWSIFSNQREFYFPPLISVLDGEYSGGKYSRISGKAVIMQSLASFSTFILLFFFASGAYVVWSVQGGKPGNGSNTISPEKDNERQVYDGTIDHRPYRLELDNKKRELNNTQAKIVEVKASLKQMKKNCQWVRKRLVNYENN